MVRLFRTLALSSLALCIWLPCANASYSAIYAFGDSLSDVGNVFNAVGLPPSPPYFNGEFSNGPIWVQDLATSLGLAPLTASRVGGTDFAYGSGETAPSSFNISNVATDILGPTGQLAQFAALHPTGADPAALYTIWIGSNDLADVLATGDPTQFSADVGTVAANIDTTIGALAGLGAKNFLVLTVPNLGLTPLAASLGPVAQSTLTGLSFGLDTTLVNGAGPIPSLANLAALEGVNIKVEDTFSLLNTIVASPASFGFTDVTDQCLVGSAVCSNPNQFLFWDDQHPTAAGHAIVAAEAKALVTPEPGYISLLGVGFAGLVLLRRRAKA